MSDIVERLRDLYYDPIVMDAADEIERLRTVTDKMMDAGAKVLERAHCDISSAFAGTGPSVKEVVRRIYVAMQEAAKAA